MRRLLGLVLAAAMFAGGCLNNQTQTSDHKPPAPASTTPGDVIPSTIPESPVDSPLPCQHGTAPTKEEMTDLLVRVSMYSPLPYLTGPALKIEEQWLEMQRAGWPEESGTWVGRTWLALEINRESDDSYVVLLRHGWLTVKATDEDRFLVVCNDGKWQVKQYARGANGPWVQPAQELPGQRGDLTPELAANLVSVAASSTGPWFAQVATGNALAWDRIAEVYRARGLKPLPNPWKSGAKGVVITPVDAEHAEGRVQANRPFLRFEKVDGLWKIQDFTEGGEWVGPPQDWRLTDTQSVFDPPFGILLGKTDAKAIEQGFGTPDSVNTTASGKVYVYNRRKLEVEFNSEGTVASFSMRSGAPGSGVRIGSPVALWELIYGLQSESSGPASQQLKYVVQDGKVTQITFAPKKGSNP